MVVGVPAGLLFGLAEYLWQLARCSLAQLADFVGVVLSYVHKCDECSSLHFKHL